MLCSIKLRNNSGYNWVKVEFEDNTEIFVKGTCFLNGKLLEKEEFAHCLYREIDKDIYGFVESLDGHFAIIVKRNSDIYAFVDYMRSIPLFLIIKDNETYLTDLIMVSDVSGAEIDTVQRDLYLNALYTLEEKTLFKNIIQLPAGHVLEIKENERNLKCYWKFEYSHAQISDLKEAIEYISNGYDELFEMVKTMVGDRQVAIPLSGGYDSRLVLNGLIKSGISRDKIIAFTYGSPDVTDAILSKKVADAVGVKHCFINYNSSKARKFFAETVKEYCDFAGNANSVPCIQDLYAIYELKKRGELSENSFIIPGHGGPLAGECLYKEFFEKEKCTEEFLLNHLLRDHVLVNYPRRNKELVDNLKYNLFETSYFNKQGEPLQNYPFGYESFYYFERQTKFILNSVRTYEFFGFSWLSPLFFKQQFNIWGKISNELRLNLYVFKETMNTYLIPELREIEFTGTKVARKINERNRYLNYVITVWKLLFDRKRIHYLFSIVPTKMFYKYLFRKKFRVGINNLIAEMYLKQLL